MFAHPVERELARLFDEHGVAWQYEPHCFVLEEGPGGSIREAFTPDFYLPELELYVECTVMKQALTSRKRRKARRASELAGIQVVLLCRRDFVRLVGRWRLARLADAMEEAA